MQKNETGPLSHTKHKINPKWVKKWNLRPGTVTLPGENAGGELLDSGLGDGFLDLTPKAETTKAEIKWDHIKLKGFCTAKETVNE